MRHTARHRQLQGPPITPVPLNYMWPNHMLSLAPLAPGAHTTTLPCLHCRPCWRRQNFSRPLAPQLPQPSRSRGSLVARAVDPDLLTDPDVPLSRLQQLLDEAIDQEDYAAAAQLRDTLQ